MFKVKKTTRVSSCLSNGNLHKMEHGSRTFISCCFICLICVAQAHTDGELLSENNTRMHNVVKSMLGFKSSPNMPRSQNNAEDAPKYMLDLYERYQNGPITRNYRQGNTVRSIKASKGHVNKEEMFVFNLTSLVSTEEIISAEIHLYRNRKTKYNTHIDIDFVLHEIAPQHTLEIGGVSIKKEIYGWQWFDVTDSVNKCMADRDTYPHSLGVTFKALTSPGSYNVLHWKSFIRQHSLPYLIVYSMESPNIDLDELEKLTERKAEKETVIQPKINAKINTVLPLKESSLSDTVLSIKTKRNKRSLSEKGEGMHAYHSRARSLSILTNEIPEDPADYSRPYPINVKGIQTHPAMLQTRKVSRHRLVDSRIIPYPGEYFDNKKKNRLLNKRKKGSKGRKNNTLELPKEWKDLKHMAEEENNANTCSKKKLIVNFNDIGWGDWIISPKSFKAHYCSGSCPFPLTKKLRPSNHATIQSVVNAVGINLDIPAPCCVPDKLSSITLLYFDENRNVVLKNYPNMTVRKCACR